ncbi:CPBP family intramembrane glutamic endopeptidase [Tropicimonas sp. TH_r6]|uniref:CPBP family intramembrane glutamic endopeptidase n=1 Tax=Tropicimonas sp. TH_r6 TaxID=3082085 RepID=UPI0029557250|nr:CPBP family intramembrane glutamic endopeptidase [Tropicimonas sp. TH_r6]MDV7144720.1 CPBP family intramembrane glutamic endopeptidase [Tropicimonas sp. TH_r6]
MRTGEFEASLEDAKLYPQLWRLVLGMALIVFILVSGGAMLVGAVVAVAHQIDSMNAVHTGAALARLQATAQGYGGIDTPFAVFLLLVTFIALFIGTLLAAAAFHFRGPGSLFGAWPDWLEGFGISLAVLVPIYLLLFGAGFLFDTPEPNLTPARWLAVLPVALPLIFIQTSSEELLFRGYLQQQLAARFRARWIWMVLPSIAFAALHYTPSAGAMLPWMLLSALIFGLIAADITEQTGNLGAAMGIHFGNNVFGMLGIAVDDTITGLALYVTPAPDFAASAQSVGMGLSICVVILVWWLTRRLLTR